MLGVVLVISPALYIFFLSLFLSFFSPREATIARCKRGKRGERGGEEEKERKEKRVGEGEGRKEGRRREGGREEALPPPSLRLIYAARKTFTA